ncbi:Purple acid phosphatase 26 isoform 1 [Hibiscus syriacus]|uniref:Purple acid phosphatase 26 isoform 1 n=1 Tax=Hibiscus syriacus TaxID=106335 RepID=A0A6A3CR50_HIBSY|nr:Purple acid phosphatase 26 isoform 1 [Hibiscus syriacus]
MTSDLPDSIQRGEEEIWFHFPPAYTCFGRKEFCLITGLQFGHDDVGRYTRHITRPSWLSRVFPDESIEKPNLHVDDMKKLFNKKDGFTRMNDVDVVRVCLLLLLYAGFLGREARQPIPQELILLVEDLNAWNLFPWGSYIWKATWTKLSSAFDDRKSLRGDGSKYTLSDFVWAFKGYRLLCILRRQIIKYKIYQVASVIEADIQAYFDCESVQNLVGTLEDLILKAKLFSILEHLLCDSSCSIRVRDQVALVIASLVRFNKDVVVGLVLMGPTVGALISMSSCCSIRVLSLLIKFIRIPLVDELEAHKQIPRIISLLSSENVAIRAEAMDCILGIAYYCRREAIEAMFEAGLVEKLVKLQGLEKYAMQLESGELLSKKEKREFKLEILRRVREASVSEADRASIVAEVLWGSSP